MKQGLRRWFIFILHALLFFTNLLVLYQLKLFDPLITGSLPLWDFDVYYRTSRDVFQGAHPYQLPYMQTLGPPSAILPFIPWSIINLSSAHKLFLLLSLLSGWFSIYLVAKKYFSEYALSLSLFLNLILLTAFPTRFTLIVGQLHLVLLPLVSILLITNNAFVKFISIWLLMVYKTFFLIGFISLMRSKLISLKAVLFVIVFMGLSFMVIKPMYYWDYISNKAVPIVFTQNAAVDLDYYNQSFKATLQRVNLPELYIPVIITAAVFSGIYLFRSQNLAAGLIISILLSPVLWQHYLSLLFPVILILFIQAWQNRSSLTLWICAFGLWWIEFPWIHGHQMTWWTRILASHYFISLVLFLWLTIILHNRSLLKASNFNQSPRAT